MSDDDDEARRWPGPPESEEEEAEIERCARLIVGDGSRPEIEGERQRRARWREMIRQRLRRPAPAYWKRSWSRFQAWIDPELQPDAAQVELAFWRRLAEQQPDNPLFAWHARRLAREAGLPVPAWVEEYLDKAAAGIFEALPSGCRTTGWLPDALGFTGARGGGASLARQFGNVRRDLDVWYQGSGVAVMIEAGLCPYCHGAQLAPCAECQGTGRWSGARKSPDAVVAELRAAAGEALEEDSVRKIRTRVNKLMAAPI